METLQAISNVIILLGTVAGAIMGIIALIGKIIGKPIKFFKKRREEHEQTRRQEITNIVLAAVKAEVCEKLDQIQKQNDNQSKNLELLQCTMRNSTGAEIMAFYEGHKVQRVVTESEKDAIEDLYKAYKAVDGNHYVDKTYKRMWSWNVVTEEGVKVENVTWWKCPNTEY